MNGQNINKLEQFHSAKPEYDSPNVELKEYVLAHRAAIVPRRQLTPAEVETLRPIIKRLYIDEGWTFRQVQWHLRTYHNYNPT